jgi:hypothetical protein
MCRYLYVCTSKASKVSTCALKASSEPEDDAACIASNSRCMLSKRIAATWSALANAHSMLARSCRTFAGTQFTCFTGTKVKILTAPRKKKSAHAHYLRRKRAEPPCERLFLDGHEEARIRELRRRVGPHRVRQLLRLEGREAAPEHFRRDGAEELGRRIPELFFFFAEDQSTVASVYYSVYLRFLLV